MYHKENTWIFNKLMMTDSLDQVKKLTQIALPILIAQVAQTLMGFVDTLMASRVSAVDVAALALGNSIWLPTIIIIGGTIMAVPAMVSRKHGAGKTEEISPLIHQTIYMAVACSCIAITILSNASIGLSQMNLVPDLLSLTIDYLDALSWGAPAFLLFQSLRCFSEGMSYAKPSMLIGFIGFFINIPANYVFIYGHFGVPALGGVGCGVATAIVYWCMAISLAAYLVYSKRFKNFKLFNSFTMINFNEQRQLFSLGVPIALAVFLEVAVFAFIAIMLAPLGATTLAANQIAVNFTMITIMLPLSIGAAVTIRVGHYLGQDNLPNAKLTIFVGQVMTAIITLIIALLIYFNRSLIASLYNSDQTTISLAVELLFWVCIFQLPNAIQAVYVAALRGYNDTLPIVWTAFITYWLIGMSLGYVLAKTHWVLPSMGASGFWLGFIVGLSIAGLLLKCRLLFIQKQMTDWIDSSPGT